MYNFSSYEVHCTRWKANENLKNGSRLSDALPLHCHCIALQKENQINTSMTCAGMSKDGQIIAAIDCMAMAAKKARMAMDLAEFSFKGQGMPSPKTSICGFFLQSWQSKLADRRGHIED